MRTPSLILPIPGESLLIVCKEHTIISLGLLMFALNLIKLLISVLSSHVCIVSVVYAVSENLFDRPDSKVTLVSPA